MQKTEPFEVFSARLAKDHLKEMQTQIGTLKTDADIDRQVTDK
jgi:hypothetical protein